MTITVEKFQDEPVIMATMTDPMNFYQEIPDMFAQILELRDSIQGHSKYYTIIDMTGIKADFSEIVFSLGEARKASQQRRPDLPNQVHLVGSGDLFEMVAKALAQIQYGGYSAPLHANTEEALEAVRVNQSKEKL